MDTWEELIRENHIPSRKSIIWDAYAAHFQGVVFIATSQLETVGPLWSSSFFLPSRQQTLWCRRGPAMLQAGSLQCCRMVNPEHRPKRPQSRTSNSQRPKITANQPQPSTSCPWKD